MKKNFVKTTLTLSLLLMAAAPAQAFAGTSCGGNVSVPLNQQTVVKDLSSCLSNNNCIKLNCSNLQSLCNLNTTAVDAAQSNDCQQVLLKNLSNLKSTSGKITLNAKDATTKNTGKSTNCPLTANQTKTNQQTPTKDTTTPTKDTTTPTKDTTTPTKDNTTTNNNTNTSTSDTAGIGSYEQQVANIVNQERAAAGLAPLTLSTELSKAAEAKAQDMLTNNYFSHTSPTYGSPFDMMKQFGISYTTAGENIAMGQQTPQSVMDAWMNSSGHKANILNSKYGKIGVGYVKGSNGTTYWVQEFTN
ncbi:CAP domain-containing protein [Clostridium aminobutyricum]|uniref:Serine protease n=1 Tax=Clostridium aminobutyricum TaxID=33953 RepID=A0A939D8W2_CLOAM|nr:CAP domain-containing protein [Clostridium aminobutyricum]MBN7772863.1 serine protease [Clostridium aminobutyricum]